MKKGITPIIAIVLLILITIAMIGFSFIFLQESLTSTAEHGKKSSEIKICTIGQTIRIENVHDGIDAIRGDSDTITIRHTGSCNIPTNSLSLYINDAFKKCAGPEPWGTEILEPEKIATCDLAVDNTITSSLLGTIKITAPGNKEELGLSSIISSNPVERHCVDDIKNYDETYIPKFSSNLYTT